MNCAIHNEVPAAAYCRTCGKALCENCKRDVRGVIYCEECIAKRLEGTMPTAAPGAPAAPIVAPVIQPASGPYPAVAGVLAGFFPFGVGQVYNGQYSKGLAHLIIFFLLVFGASNAGGSWDVLFGLSIAFFYIYQIVDAARSARAIQLGQPAPDPLGLARTFGGAGTVDTSKIPIGAIILIGIGVLFLLDNLGIFRWRWVGHLWPLILIAIGVAIFIRRRESTVCGCARCGTRGVMWPAILVTVGVLILIDEFRLIDFDRTWPILLLVVGAVRIWQSTSSDEGHIEAQLPPTTPPPAVPANEEVRHG